MNRIVKSEDGSMLGIAMIYFLVFSATGIAVLQLAAYLRLDILDRVHAIKNEYAIESTLNMALWRMNNGPDSLANFEYDGVTSQYNDSTRILHISTNKWDQTQQIYVELQQDFHFNHGVAYLEEPDTSKYSVTTLPGHGLRQFDFLPTIDTSYYRQRAIQIYTTGTTSFNDTLPSGIHYVESGTVFLKDGAYLEGTLVVLGKLKIVGTNVVLKAIPDSAGVFIPALIVADSTADISTTPGITVEGAIFSQGPFDIKGGSLTGPLVGPSVVLSKNLVIDDLANERYYIWPPGFGAFNSYDWPKQIKTGTWRN